MFVYLMTLFVGLQVNTVTVDAYIEGCLLDMRQQIDEDQVMHVLGEFYKYLIFANAVTGLRHERHYGQVMEEVKRTIGEEDKIISSQLTRVISLLDADRYSDVIKMCDDLGREWDNEVHWGWRYEDHETRQRIVSMAKTYLCYFRAEAHRLMGNDYLALEQMSDATRSRQISTGVSLNELERLNGLIAIQRVLRFNKEIDKMFGLVMGPSIGIFRSSYWTLQGSTDPLKDGSWYRRKDRSLDDTSGHSVSHIAAKSILCEFARKSSIIESSFSSDTDINKHYVSVLKELKQIDAYFANKLDNLVERHEQAWAVAESLIESMRRLTSDNSAQKEHLMTLETYAKYLQSDTYRRQDDWESLMPAEALLNEVKTIRQVLPGVSLGKLATLDGVIVFKLLRSFNKRITFVYQLKGDESKEELIERRRHLGTCQKVLPPVNF